MDIDASINAFIQRWQGSGASERSNYQLFLNELCELLDVPRPEPRNEGERDNAYVFEKSVKVLRDDGGETTNYIDLYKRGCFVLEAKQGSSPTTESPLFGVSAPTGGRKGHGRRGSGTLETALQKAKNQAERYVRALSADEGRPPFIVVADVGHSFDLYSEFSRTGGAYVPFPDAQSNRILLEDLHDPGIRERLQAIWTDPLSLDPARRSARVTRDIARSLAKLAKSLEGEGHHPEQVAGFLMRTLFTMFAEDVKLLPENSFRELLESVRGDTEHFKDIIEPLWQTMNTGGYSRDLRKDVLKFNGGLFAEPDALPVNEAQLEHLITAAEADWKEVEPAIFGTLLERALDPHERHKLGAHYTPRAYVERLVLPTLVEPLRGEWQGVQAAVTQHRLSGKNKEAVNEVKTFHAKLCNLRVLDPACGSGNFLYVTLEHLKRLEGEVLETLAELGEEQGLLELEGVTVSPEQFLGLEVNPRAAKIAELVLWIGYLQWHFRTHGTRPPEPIIRDFGNIKTQDAVLAYDGVQPALNEDGEPKTRWDGRTFKKHPVTGEDVPDEGATVEELAYLNPRKAEWPEADYVVGNPPFIGTAKMWDALGEGYAKTVRKVYKDVPESSDFVMYWWEKAANLLRDGEIRRFGFIATNSLRQTFNRRVLERHMAAKNPLSLVFAIPDHPWVDASDGAAVGISMTVAAPGELEGTLKQVTEEISEGDGYSDVLLSTEAGIIFPNLTVGVDVGSAVELKANEDLSNRGVMLAGSGFIVEPDEAETLGLGRIDGIERRVRRYRNGRDITQTSRDVMVIDLFGLEANEAREKYPTLYQHVYENVKPQRDTNKRKSRRENWWLFGETNPKLRNQLEGLKRYIATVETSKHRFFIFLDESILPDNMLVNIALEDAYFLGVLSSRAHVTWALAAGGDLGGNTPRYNKTRCFEPYPFPDPTEGQTKQIRELAESLDAHRKRQQAQYPDLTLTGMYNVLEKLRSGEALDDKERTLHEQGLVSVLKELHDDLDAAVFGAYGWSTGLSDEEILQRLVDLNAERAAEEAQGLVRWLRPAYQDPDGVAQEQQIELDVPQVAAQKVGKQSWPKTLPEQAQAVRLVVSSLNVPASPAEVAGLFKRARQEKVAEILQTLSALGQLEPTDDGRYLA